ncbi:YdcH family protein [Ideonella oryzae]|uniref:YdcH family protein n=1 Tax=Ideonella oryzae TaxID=2937441 RepID=A0ABT1BK98_9BURK|nr:YdcH family protein [Ideonella oryzae]MCO5976523.1 YdcH family protein [Ideonella oryzae]
MAHAELDNRIDGADSLSGPDELALRRLKKQRLVLRDQIAQLEAMLEPPEPA